MTQPAVGSIRRRSTFRALRQPHARATRAPVSVSFVAVPRRLGTPKAQVGYAIGRNCGNAVARNRLRRRLRAAVRSPQAVDHLCDGAYLLRAAPGAARAEYRRLESAVVAALAEIGTGTGGEMRA